MSIDSDLGQVGAEPRSTTAAATAFGCTANSPTKANPFGTSPFFNGVKDENEEFTLPALVEGAIIPPSAPKANSPWTSPSLHGTNG